MSKSMWAQLMAFLPILVGAVWLQHTGRLELLGGWIIGLFFLFVCVVNYFAQTVKLHEVFIRVGKSRIFMKDIVAFDRGRFVINVSDAYGERLTIRRWILTCKAEEELDEWLARVARGSVE